MICLTCQHDKSHKHGKDRQGRQRFKCASCGATFVEPHSRPLGTLRTSLKDASTALGMLLEGMSIRAVERLTVICRKTLCDIILVAGENCQRFLETTVQNVEAKDVQLDELWSFVALKEKRRILRGYSEAFGDTWTWLAIDRDTKMILAHEVGRRDDVTCRAFLQKLNRATTGRFQLSTDGLKSYELNVPFTFGERVDFAQLIKSYESSQEETRYSPAKIISAERIPRYGNPDPARISTSHVERMNLSVRMHVRRFTRLTNAHSKSPKHHAAMTALFIAWYCFCRKHETLKGRTPAMAAGLTDQPRTIRRLLQEASEGTVNT